MAHLCRGWEQATLEVSVIAHGDFIADRAGGAHGMGLLWIWPVRAALVRAAAVQLKADRRHVPAASHAACPS